MISKPGIPEIATTAHRLTAHGGLVILVA